MYHLLAIIADDTYTNNVFLRSRANSGDAWLVTPMPLILNGVFSSPISFQTYFRKQNDFQKRSATLFPTHSETRNKR